MRLRTGFPASPGASASTGSTSQTNPASRKRHDLAREHNFCITQEPLSLLHGYFNADAGLIDRFDAERS